MKERLVNTLLDAGYSGEDITSIMKHIPEEDTPSDFKHDSDNLWTALNLTFQEVKSMFSVLISVPDDKTVTYRAEYLVNNLSKKQMVAFLSRCIQIGDVVEQNIKALKHNAKLEYAIDNEDQMFIQDMDQDDPVAKFMVKHNLPHIVCTQKGLYIPVRTQDGVNDLKKIESVIMTMKVFCDITDTALKAVNKGNKICLYAVKFDKNTTSAMIAAAYD